MTALLLVALAGTANVALVAFVADRLTPKDAAVTAAGELVVVNDNAPASAVKLAA
ncbi:hypothetical protein [Methylobacterium sp. Leaf125]|jgi:hypothetical protein|uniref:hypothetical protein n=1 Tax=Methylobacterium sp. Leaf125 TaxID=1736265 RepID=UPI000A8A872F|nr:hypothetical protein [Methylobacterium sp. Leaf125]